MFFILLAIGLLVFLDSSLVNFLVALWILSVDIYLFIFKDYAFRWVFIEDDVQWDELLFLTSEKRMLLHLIPVWSKIWIILHRVIQKVKTLQ